MSRAPEQNSYHTQSDESPETGVYSGKQQDLLATLSSLFMRADSVIADDVFTTALACFGSYTGVSSATLWHIPEDFDIADARYHWHAGSSSIAHAAHDRLRLTEFPFIITTLMSREICILPNAEAADRGNRFLSLYKLTGVLILPLHIGRRIIGCLSLESSSEVPPWQTEELQFFKTVAEFFTTTLNRVMAEEELRSTIDTYQILLDSYSDGLCVLDIMGFIIRVNETYCTIVGYTEDELLGMHISQLEVDKSTTDVNFAISEIMEKRHKRFETRHNRKDGTGVNLDISTTYLPIKGGQIFGFIRDITHQKRTTQILAHRLETITNPEEESVRLQLEDLFNPEDLQTIQDAFSSATGVASLITRPDGTPVTKPSGFCHMCMDIMRSTKASNSHCIATGSPLGTPNMEGPTIFRCQHSGLLRGGASIFAENTHLGNWLAGQVREDTSSDEDFHDFAEKADVSMDAFMQVLKEVPVMSREQFSNICNSLFSIASQLSLLALRNLNQAREISHRNTIEAELTQSKQITEQATRAKSEFLANMSHEIRTPLNAIIGMSRLVLDSKLSRDQKEKLSIINNASEILLSLINDILDFSKIEAGRLELDERDFNLKTMCLEIQEMFVIRAREKGLGFSFNITPGIPEFIHADSIRARQILLNLISNAVKFTEKGAIDITVEMDQDASESRQVRITVSDTGIGIRKENIESLFDAFTQADSSASRQFGGTGLGLSISKKLVILMGGKIGVESTPGKGSNFWFTLPLKQIKLPKQKSTSLSIAQKHLTIPNSLKKKTRILLVEDKKSNQAVACALLKKMGFSADTAENGEIALKLLSEKHYDLVFMDIQMPIMDGYEATQKIRKLEGLVGEVPIIAMTAHALKGDRDQCLSRGMDDYLSKPIDPHELLSAIEKQLVMKK